MDPADYEDDDDDNPGGIQQNMMVGVAGGMGPGAAHIGMPLNSDLEGGGPIAIGQVPVVIDTSSQDMDDTEVVDYRGIYSH
jgi:hypothetical protein